MSFNTETYFFMKYDSVAVQASVQVMDYSRGDSVPELYAPEASECYEQAGNLWTAPLPPLLSADPSGLPYFTIACRYSLGLYYSPQDL